jgi:hypothetical protein
MARNFPGTASNYISIGDTTSARFLSTEAWTVLAYVRHETLTANQCPIGKWSTTNSLKQMFVRVRSNGSFQVFHNGTPARITSSNGLAQTDTWYLYAVSNDGSSNMDCRIVEADGTILFNGAGTTTGDASDLTEPVNIGAREAGATDPVDGDIAYVAYIRAELTQEQIVAIAMGGIRGILQYNTDTGGTRDLQYFFPLIGNVSPEVDWSGEDVAGTITGTLGVGDNPPIGPIFGFAHGFQGNVEAVAAAVPNVESYLQIGQPLTKWGEFEVVSY